MSNPVAAALTDPGNEVRLSPIALSEAMVLAGKRRVLLEPDPADRFPVATAQVYDLTLATAHRRLLGLGSVKVLASR